MRWLRKYIRSKMHPVDADDAREWKGVFSVLYGIMAWNLFGFLAYTWMKDKLPRNQDSVDYAKLLGIKESRVIKFSGFQKVDEFDMKIPDADLDQYITDVLEHKDINEVKERNTVETKKNELQSEEK